MSELCNKAALILSRYKDIPQMGGRTVGVTLIATLCTYSREAAIEYTLKASGAGAIVLSGAMLKAVGRFMHSLFPTIQRIPSWVWLVGLALFIAALAFPKTRAWLYAAIELLPEKTKKLGAELFGILDPLLEQHEQARRNADNALDKAKGELAV